MLFWLRHRIVFIPFAIFAWVWLFWLDLSGRQVFLSGVLIVQFGLAAFVCLLAIIIIPFFFLSVGQRAGMLCLKVFGVVLLFLVGPLFASGLVWGHWTNASMQEGDRIVTALDRYHDVYKEFPGRLEELIPDYIDAIQETRNPMWKKPFHYSRRDDEYTLGFDAGAMVFCRYNETWAARAWYCDD